VPADADRTNYYSTAISMTALREAADLIPAKHVYFVMDSCYSGLAMSRGAGAFSRGPVVPRGGDAAYGCGRSSPPGARSKRWLTTGLAVIRYSLGAATGLDGPADLAAMALSPLRN